MGELFFERATAAPGGWLGIATPSSWRPGLSDSLFSKSTFGVQPRLALLKSTRKGSTVMAGQSQAPGVSLVRYADLGGETFDGCQPTPAGRRAIAAAIKALL